MRAIYLLAGSALLFAGCSTRSVGGVPIPGPDGDVVVVREEGRGGDVYARSARVPPGHYPPPGECRIWYMGRPPGQQPPPGRCDSFIGRVPYGAFLLYNDKEWDTQYDWRRESARRPGSVPDIVLRIMNSLVRN